MYTGKCGYAFNCNKWKNNCGKCPQLKDYPKSYLFDFSRYLHNKKIRIMSDFERLIIVTPSIWLSKRIEQSFLKNKKILTINNGIDTDNIFYYRNDLNVKAKYNLHNKKIVLSVAPDIMSTRKGGVHVLKVAEMFSDTNIVFIMIGVEDLNGLVLPNNVIALQRTDNQIELANFYSIADVFLICSSKENFPTTCVEAMCCGTPIVGYNEGGTSETAINGYGIFVGYGDLLSIKSGIESFVNIDIDKKNLSETSINKYSKKIMTRHYIDLYIDAKKEVE